MGFSLFPAGFHRRRSRTFAALLSGALVLSAAAQQPPSLQILPPLNPRAGPRLNSSLQAETLLRLERSANLADWTEAAVAHDALRDFPDLETGGAARGFYRLLTRPRAAADDWKNQLLFPEDAFLTSWNGENARWVKFVILTDRPDRIYYQDSTKYPFHYDFALQRLTPFQGMSRAQFDAVSLRRANQKAVLGAVLFPPRPDFAEYGVQFVGLDAYTPDEISRWYEPVKATIHAATGAGACYMPVFEQLEAVRRDAAAYQAKGITVASLERWISTNHCYAPGWALGRLKFFPSAEINAAFTDGRLKPEDILLTDGVPAETPLVAGIISLTPSTPNSHTAILAQSFGIPFVHLPDAADRERVQQLAGRKIILRALISNGAGLVKVIDAEGTLDPAAEAELLALKQPEPLEFTPKKSLGAINVSVEGLKPADIQYVGGKAANYAVLRKAIPSNCPKAIALSFDLWDAFMDQSLTGGRTLRAEIAARLAPHSHYPPEMAALKTALAGVRDLIAKTADFNTAQRNAILDALAAAEFTPNRKIRFRSSTNMEDAETFTGAGLYDSYSGCLLDDLDGDSAGPCACEPAEPEERGVFRAIRKVYAGFYNDNAFLERLRRGVDESKTGMGVLAHHSFPDEEELANGVATLQFYYDTSYGMNGKMVTQAGAEPVTNPDGSSVPEVVQASTYEKFGDVNLQQQSSRLPLGAFVMNWRDDYLNFLKLFQPVADVWRAEHPGKNVFELDFEYKKDVNLGLIVKQVRALPSPAAAEPLTAFLVNDPAVWCVAQREAGDVFANHRLKSVWNLQVAGKRLTPQNLAAGLYTQGTLDYEEDGQVRALTGSLSAWPEASHTPDGRLNRWKTGAGTGLRSWELTTELTATVTGAQPPVFTQNDFPAQVTVTYATPVPAIDFDGKFITRSSDTAYPEVRRGIVPGSTLQQRTMENSKGLTAQTSFYWPPKPGGLTAGYTAPLLRFVETRVTGLTSQPLVLTNYWSQTYRPGHHNFSEEFIFEPRLEPGISPALLAELAAANIRYLHIEIGNGDPVFHAAGLDGKLRRL